MNIPEPSFAHLFRLSDDTGILEHAWYALARRECGYTTDDVARALIVICHVPLPTPGLIELAGIYLTFLRDACNNGRYHNRFSYDRQWLDEAGSDDCRGRALWALGTTIRHAPTRWLRLAASKLFEESCKLDSTHSRPNAYAILGCAEILAADPEHRLARTLLERCAAALPLPAEPAWPWPEPRLTYDNARLPQAMLLAGEHLATPRLESHGLRLLKWLVHIETSGDHFSFAGTRGRGPADTSPAFDQQPIEALAMADACGCAWEKTQDTIWLQRAQRAVLWFTGENDIGVSLYDGDTGGCRDGLTATGANQNQGAESTLAAIAAFQLSQRLAKRQAAASADSNSVSWIDPAPTARSAAP